MIKKVCLLILSLVAAGVAGFALLASDQLAPQTQQTTENQDETTIVAIGDSITVGVGASFIDFSYVNRLSEAVGIDIINEGVSGDTSRDVLDRLPSIIEQNPDIAIVFIGGNDALQGVPASTARENIIVIINQLEQSGAEVLLLGAQDVPFGISEYADIYTEIVESTMVTAVPGFFDGILEAPNLLADPIHPNDEGYAVIAERALPGLQKLLE